MVRRPDPRPLIHSLVHGLLHALIRLANDTVHKLIRLTRPIHGPVRRLAAAGAGAGIEKRFTSRLHDERVAAWLGVWLGISFTVAFVTGLVSHFMQHPPAWMVWPARPVDLYRLTQGTHVICGMATIPLLLAKLWTVYPKFWQWPPLRGLAHALQRAVVLLLVGGSLFQLVTGLFNVDYWYPFPFFFPVAHYWTAYVVFGALLMHVADEWAKVRRLGHRAPEPPGSGLGRRGFLAGSCCRPSTFFSLWI